MQSGALAFGWSEPPNDPFFYLILMDFGFRDAATPHRYSRAMYAQGIS